MPRTDISFQTSDGVTLRGWVYKPDQNSIDTKIPCLILTHGLTCIKEMGLDHAAASLTSALPLICLVYDHRGSGSSDTLSTQPRGEALPWQQCTDLQDAITFAQTLEGVDKDKIGLWGYSYAGGHSLYVGASDRRIKAVLSLAPAVDGWENTLRLVRTDLVAGLNAAFEMDRLSRAAGNPAIMMPVVS